MRREEEKEEDNEENLNELKRGVFGIFIQIKWSVLGSLLTCRIQYSCIVAPHRSPS